MKQAGMRSRYMMGNLGEIACRRDVNGRVTTCQNRAIPSPALSRRQKKRLQTGLRSLRNRSRVPLPVVTARSVCVT